MLTRVASVDFSPERAEGTGLARMEGGHTSLPVIHSAVEPPLASGRGGLGLSLNLSLCLRCKMKVLAGWP